MSGRHVYMAGQSDKPGAKAGGEGGGGGRTVSRLVVVNSPSSKGRLERDWGRGRTVKVGNLSWDVTWKDLKVCMAEAGEVTRADVRRSESGRPSGEGVVEFRDSAAAELAVGSLDGSLLKGREITVQFDEELTQRRGGGATNNRVFVGNLTYEVQWQDLKDAMRCAGTVVRADILTEARTGRSAGCGVVEFATTEEANYAIETLNETEIMGRRIFLRGDREPPTAFELPAAGKAKATAKATEKGKGKVRDDDSGGEADGNQDNRMYVGNLPFNVAWQDLKDHIRSQGFNVKSVDIMLKGFGKSKGCAIVEFFDGDTTKRAIAKLNNTMFMGRQMYIREDREAAKKV